SLKRREFIRLSAGSASFGGALLSGIPLLPQTRTSLVAAPGAAPNATPNAAPLLDALEPMTGDVTPITAEERQSRIAKAQRLMAANKIGAIVLDSSTSMVYFTGMSWGASERPMVAVIPAQGDVKYVCPAFEAERLRELI